MNKTTVVDKIIGSLALPKNNTAKAFAPTNIALCKYWGKRDQALNLPVTNSLSISLTPEGTKTQITLNEKNEDRIFLNGEKIENHTAFACKLINYLDLFRHDNSPRFTVHTDNTIPVAAGLASSASGFAALAKTLNVLYDWKLPPHKLSILARLGSGSACRSLWDGFVEWEQGTDPLGMDCHGKPIDTAWPEFCVGIMTLSNQQKSISSRDAMQQTVETSHLYQAWPKQVEQDLKAIKAAISQQDFAKLGQHSEHNANAMHATLMASWPSFTYHHPQTIEVMQRVWDLRKQGLAIYYTQDAGPNIKLLFLLKDQSTVLQHFPDCQVIQPFVTKL